MEIFAFFACASTLDVVHTNSNGVSCRINHRPICRVTKTAFELATSAVATQKISAHLSKLHKQQLEIHKHAWIRFDCPWFLHKGYRVLYGIYFKVNTST